MQEKGDENPKWSKERTEGREEELPAAGAATPKDNKTSWLKEKNGEALQRERNTPETPHQGHVQLLLQECNAVQRQGENKAVEEGKFQRDRKEPGTAKEKKEG